jgi:hypothetical protein
MHTKTADIDSALVPIIQMLWRRGYQTCFCCQGYSETDFEGAHQAYIKFGTHIEAALFYAYCGPARWTNAQHAQRHRERPGGSERWRWDWRLESVTVRFPNRDIGRVAKAVEHIPSLRALIRPVSNTAMPLPSPIPTCPGCGLDLLGARLAAADAHQPAPPRCPTCGGVVMARRKDARYCSRRCQLAARDRRRTKD